MVFDPAPMHEKEDDSQKIIASEVQGPARIIAITEGKWTIYTQERGEEDEEFCSFERFYGSEFFLEPGQILKCENNNGTAWGYLRRHPNEPKLTTTR